MFEIIDEKIRVFISSNCRDENYQIVRGALKNILEETGFIKTYVFEYQGASSSTAEEDYLSKLDDSHVVLFLIDNKDINGNIPEGVMKEYLRAKELEKKSIFVFCNAEKDRITNLQMELNSKSGKANHYFVVSRLRDFVEQSYQSVVNDIMNTYKLFCKGRISRISGQSINKENSFISTSINQEQFEPLGISKQYFNGFSKSQGFLWNTYYEKKQQDKNSYNYIDEFCFHTLQHLIGELPYSIQKVDELIVEFKKQNRSDYVILRWEAIKAYYTNDISKAISLLSQSYSKAELSNESQWIKDDILIDKRYMESISMNMQNSFGLTEAQKKLNESKSFLFYPVIDRVLDRIYSEMLKEIYELSIQNPGSLRMSNVFKEIFSEIEKCVFISVHFGSFIHLQSIRKVLLDVSFHLSKYYSDSWVKYLCLQMAALNSDADIAKKTFEHFISYLNRCSFEKVYELYSILEVLPLDVSKSRMKLTIFQNIGFYMSDADFFRCESEMFDIANSWITKENSIVTMGHPLIQCMQYNVSRVNNNKIVEFAIQVFQKTFKRFYDDISELLCYVEWGSISDSLKKQVINLIDNFIINGEMRNELHRLQRLIIVIRKVCSELTNHWDELLKKEWLNFYENSYSLEILDLFINNETRHIIRFVEQIETRNSAQGVNGLYSGYGVNLYDTIINILDNKSVEIDLSNIAQPISSVLLKVLYNEKQTIGEKIDCFKLLIALQSNCELNKVDFDWTSYASEIFDNLDIIYSGNQLDFFENNKSSILKLYAFLYQVINGLGNEQKVLSSFAQFSNIESFEGLQFIKCILDYIRFYRRINASEMPYILYVLQIIFGKSYDEYYATRYYAVECFGALCKTAFSDTIIARLSEMMEDHDHRVRLCVLKHVDIIKESNEKYFNHIIQKAKVDNHFLVRAKANSITEITKKQ